MTRIETSDWTSLISVLLGNGPCDLGSILRGRGKVMHNQKFWTFFFKFLSEIYRNTILLNFLNVFIFYFLKRKLFFWCKIIQKNIIVYNYLWLEFLAPIRAINCDGTSKSSYVFVELAILDYSSTAWLWNIYSW